MAFKTENFFYRGPASATALTDIVATVTLNGAPTPVATNLAATELNRSALPGVYLVSLTPSMITGYGGAGRYSVTFSSASHPNVYSDESRFISATNTDDIDAHLTAQDATLTALTTTLNSTSTNVSAIKTDLETGPYNLGAVMAGIQALQTGQQSIQNNTTFQYSIPTLVKPTSGTKPYICSFVVQNANGSAVDTDSRIMNVQVINPSGTDMGSSFNNYTAPTGGATVGTIAATRTALGIYQVTLNLSSAQNEEDWIFTESYTQNAVAFNKQQTETIINNVQADGLATAVSVAGVQSTVNGIASTTTDTNTTVHTNNGLLTNATYGLQANNTLLTGIKTQTDKLGDPTIGLGNITSNLSAIEGSGFNSSNHSLAAIAQLIINNVYTGNRAF